MSDPVSKTGIGLAAYRSYNSWRNEQQAQVRDITSNLDYQGSKIRTANVQLANAVAQVKAAGAVAATRQDIRPPSFYNKGAKSTPTIPLINNILNKFV